MTVDLLIIGAAIALEPLPLTAFIIVLASQHGLRKGVGFLCGWVASFIAVIAITILATGNNPPRPSTAPSQAILVVKIVIGVALLIIAARQRAKLQRPREPKPPPKWQRQIDQASPAYAAGLAFLLQPWGLIAAGAATITQAHLQSWHGAIPLVAFVLVSTSTYFAMTLYAWRRPTATMDRLARIRTWLDTHTDVLIAWIALLVGLWLIVDSGYLLVT
jgi:hypothetical protein